MSPKSQTASNLFPHISLSLFIQREKTAEFLYGFLMSSTCSFSGHCKIFHELESTKFFYCQACLPPFHLDPAKFFTRQNYTVYSHLNIKNKEKRNLIKREVKQKEKRKAISNQRLNEAEMLVSRVNLAICQQCT